MKLLLDTHAIIWWWNSPERLSEKAMDAIRNPENEIHVSAASAYEILFKYRIGKLKVPTEVAFNFSSCVSRESWESLELTIKHTSIAALLKEEHRDPFDRLLAAQSIFENLPLVTADALIADFSGVEIYW